MLSNGICVVVCCGPRAARVVWLLMSHSMSTSGRTATVAGPATASHFVAFEWELLLQYWLLLSAAQCRLQQVSWHDCLQGALEPLNGVHYTCSLQAAVY
jgi:hypothetical protein